MKRTAGGVVTWYIYDGDTMIAEKSETGYTEYEIPGVGWVSPTGSGYSTTYTLTNQRGDTVGLAAGNQVTNIRDYDAYGGFHTLLANSDSDHRYVGGKGVIWNNASQTYTMGLREYSPYLGRFLNQDPIGYKGGLNLYAYCGNEPVLRIDANGTSDQVNNSLLFDHGQKGAAYRHGLNMSYIGWWSTHMKGALNIKANCLPSSFAIPSAPRGYDFGKAFSQAHFLGLMDESPLATDIKLTYLLVRVAPKGEMDFKDGHYDTEDGYYNLVDFGNFNYGIIGMALGISEATLLDSSGATVRFRMSDRKGPWYGDQPRDSFYVQMGISFYKSNYGKK